MVIYTVHEPPNAPANHLESAEELAFVKDGFSWFAAFAPWFWLIAKRMWLELFLFTVAAIGIVSIASAVGAPNTGNAILLIAQIVIGFESGALYGAALGRRGWRLVGTVSGRNQEDCERRFLEVWLPTRTEIPMSPPFSAPNPPSWPETALAQLKNPFTARGSRTPAGA